MSATKNAKRRVSSDSDTGIKRTKPTKEYQICRSEVPSFKTSPSTCKDEDGNKDIHGADNRACDECWEAHLSFEVEEKRPEKVACMFCTSNIGHDELRRLARLATLVRYEDKLFHSKHRKCMARCQSLNTAFQLHDCEKDGRVFCCKFCGHQSCTDCDRPEHPKQTCEQYQKTLAQTVVTTLGKTHAQAEADTSAAFKRCPNADCRIVIWTERCGYTVCQACKFRFCSRCMIPWVGYGSAYLGGKEAHKQGCHYRTRDSESAHTLKRRFALAVEIVLRMLAKEKEKRMKAAEKKKAEANETARGMEEIYMSGLLCPC